MRRGVTRVEGMRMSAEVRPNHTLETAAPVQMAEVSFSLLFFTTLEPRVE